MEQSSRIYEQKKDGSICMSKRKMEAFVNYEPVLLEFGGDNKRGRKEYQKLICSNMADGLEIKDKVIGQSILGGEEFIEWIKNNFFEKERDRERPPLLKIQKYMAKEAIIEAVEKEVGESIDWIKKERGTLRQITIDLLYRVGGLNGRAIADIFGVDYSTVSIGRKRLREKVKKDKKIRNLVRRLEANLSMLNRLSNNAKSQKSTIENKGVIGTKTAKKLINRQPVKI
ncbi:MAG: hypothetical protein V3U15_02725, partial [Nitrospinota bacterium]